MCPEADSEAVCNIFSLMLHRESPVLNELLHCYISWEEIYTLVNTALRGLLFRPKHRYTVQ